MEEVLAKMEAWAGRGHGRCGGDLKRIQEHILIESIAQRKRPLWKLFCFRPCRDISTAQPEEAAGPTYENLGSIYQRNGDKGGCKDEEETDSSASRRRRSFSSFAIERGFLKWVLGSNDKDRGLEREREPVHNGRKIEKKPEPAGIVQEANHAKTVNSNEVMEEAVSEGNEGLKENSIFSSQEPPSFRGSENQAVARRRKAKFRTASLEQSSMPSTPPESVHKSVGEVQYLTLTSLLPTSKTIHNPMNLPRVTSSKPTLAALLPLKLPKYPDYSTCRSMN
ncbi:unnamed protein product [Dovyalis caffra]|uniref:Uncharacterized protein n=1 Tax=Dovyalis caffra TaxID=77055 RepID=A0AAV1R368_9ROSI|nr:unnamed protein product [Dovyalis caffra]